MKPEKSRLALILTMSLLTVMQQPWAGETTEVQVRASVIANCKILGVQDINFGALDPGQAVNINAEGFVSFACTRGVDFRMSADRGENYEASSGVRRMKGTTAEFLPYRIDKNVYSGVGSGFTHPTSFRVQASVNAADYQDLPADNYRDTLRITLEP